MPLVSVPLSSVVTPAAATAAQPDIRLATARAELGSKDPFRREAGTQLLAGLTTPEALRLLEAACEDKNERVIEGGLRALVQSVATGSTEAETALLLLITRRVRVRELLKKGMSNQLGALPPDGFDASRLVFLASNQELAGSRLKSLKAGNAHKVQAYRSARLRDNPAFAAFFETLRSDPDLTRTLKALLLRRREFLRDENGKPRTLEPFWGDTRRMTGLFAAVGADAGLTALMNLVMDRTARRETDALWARIAGPKSAPLLYAPEIVIGSGPHGANLCSTLATLRPDQPPLVIERRDRLGGQFAAPGGAAWRMNSRARPLSEDRRAVPGSRDALNSLGPYAPVQEGDLTGQGYASQDTIALATRMSLFLSCRALVGTRFVERHANTREVRSALGLPIEGPLIGRYLAQLQN